jgi:hypothetical protein
LKIARSEIQNSQESMRQRNKVVREKLNDIDKDMKQKASIINDKQFLKMLGIKAYIQDFYVDENEMETNLLEIKFELMKSTDHYITIVYDTITDDFDRKNPPQTACMFMTFIIISVLDIQPDCNNYDEIRKLLRHTRDIQGLLSTYKESLQP